MSRRMHLLEMSARVRDGLVYAWGSAVDEKSDAGGPMVAWVSRFPVSSPLGAPILERLGPSVHAPVPTSMLGLYQAADDATRVEGAARLQRRSLDRQVYGSDGSLELAGQRVQSVYLAHGLALASIYDEQTVRVGTVPFRGRDGIVLTCVFLRGAYWVQIVAPLAVISSPGGSA